MRVISVVALSLFAVLLDFVVLSAHAQTAGMVEEWGHYRLPPSEEFVDIAEVSSTGNGRYLALKEDGSLMAWGPNDYGLCNLPEPNSGFTAIAAGNSHNLALRSDGSIEAWGSSSWDVCDVPAPNTGFIEIATGEYLSGAIRADGSIVIWGREQLIGAFPASEQNEDFVDLVLGRGFCIGVKSDGSAVGWGTENDNGQADVPVLSHPIVDLAAGPLHVLALLSNGSLAAWGRDGNLGTIDPENYLPEDNSGFIAIAAPFSYSDDSYALRDDGNIIKVGLGLSGYEVPSGYCTAGGVDPDFVALTPAFQHVMALRSDGTMATWDLVLPIAMCYPDDGTAQIGAAGVGDWAYRPDGAFAGWNGAGGIVPNLEGEFVKFAGGTEHLLGLHPDGSIDAWGSNYTGETDLPSWNQDYLDIAAASGTSFALRPDGSLRAWGWGTSLWEVPEPNADFTAIFANGNIAVGIKDDMTVVPWGLWWVDDLPTEENYGFTSIAIGRRHILGLRFDGSIFAWNYAGPIEIPAPNADFLAVAAGDDHSLGLKEDGTIIAWGDNSRGQLDIPEPNTGFTAIAAYGNRSLAIRSTVSVTAAPEVPAVRQPVQFVSARPNPFNPSTTIEFVAPVNERVKVRAFDLRGREVDTVFEGAGAGASMTITWQPEGLASGVYFLRVESPAGDDAIRVALVK